MKKIIGVFTVALLTSMAIAQTTLNKSIESATAIFKDNILTVSTGKCSQQWQLEPYGLSTISIKNSVTGKQWADSKIHKCEWAFYGLIDENSTGNLLSVKAIESTDSGFTSKHLLVTAEFEYPAVETFVKYEIRAYPNAEGIYTRVSFKGNSSKYLKVEKKKPGIKFNLVHGKEEYDYLMNGSSENHIADFTSDPEKIEYLIDGLNKKKSYKVGISWRDFKGQNIKQSVTVSSVDGETTRELLAPEFIHNFKKNEKPEEQVFDLPSDVLLDGSFRLMVNKKEGVNAIISEIWILETSSQEYAIAGNIDRLKNLRSNLQDGQTLAGYCNCGDRSKMELSSITGRVAFLPIKADKLQRRYAGYYNDTQHRNKRETPLIKEEVIKTPISGKENVDWANILFVESGTDALVLVKESNKCVNQYGYETGDFEVSESGIANTGTALSVKEILPDRYRNAWATWIVATKNGTDERELSLKQFERTRFPINSETDIYIIANTWGSDRAYEAAREANVMVELESQKQLGIDVQQIDDGYQKDNSGKQTGGWYPHPDRYPNGFKGVRAKADSLNMKLGLWFAAMQVSLPEMKTNYDSARFAFYKLDFANIKNHNDIEKMMLKIRAYELYTHHQSKVNWDVTENASRFGYFWAKEYGCVFLENRKTAKPENVVYVPYLVLRDLWQLSKYCNLNKFQGSVQNKDMVNPAASDAIKHSHPYTAAIPLMSTPLFFQETHFYSQEAKNQIKEVISAYKAVRNEMYDCIVYPIGEEPSNANWSGFQAQYPNKKQGYVTLFREIENKDAQKNIKLRFLKNIEIKFTNLMNKESFSAKADKEGFVKFDIVNAGDFRFLKYEY